MKAYIKEVDWADEGDIFFYSIIEEETLKTLSRAVTKCIQQGLVKEREFYWGTNEAFTFNYTDLLEFIRDAQDITSDELLVFRKFKITGYDIYQRITDKLLDYIYDWDWRAGKYTICEGVTEKFLKDIEPDLIKLHGQDTVNEIWDIFNENA